ncbi:MAG: Spo0B domain-containing protein, partial [Clostridium sp.]
MITKKQSYKISKITLLSIILSLMQVVFITIFIYYKKQNPEIIYGDYLIYLLALIIGVNSIITGVIFYNFLFKKGSNNLIDTLKHLEELNKTLRTQRHDYLNHIQVIYSLIELEEFEEARKY